MEKQPLQRGNPPVAENDALKFGERYEVADPRSWAMTLPFDQAAFPPVAGGNCIIIGFGLSSDVPNSIMLGEGDSWVRIHANGVLEWSPACNAARIVDAVGRALGNCDHAVGQNAAVGHNAKVSASPI